jgi:hypothetical protein
MILNGEMGKGREPSSRHQKLIPKRSNAFNRVAKIEPRWRHEPRLRWIRTGAGEETMDSFRPVVGDGNESRGAHMTRNYNELSRATTCAGTAVIALALAISLPSVAWAETDFVPYGKLGYEHDSNIFAFPSAGPDIPPDAPTAQADSRASFVAGADVSGQYAQQRLTAKVEGRRFLYDRLSDLNHYESLANGELNYQIGSRVDGVVRARIEKRMAAFTDRVSSTLAIETEKASFATIRFLLTPEWSFQPDAGRRDLDSPQRFYPDLRLREDTYGAVLAYAGLGRMRVGLEGVHLSGVYTGVTGVPSVSQSLLQLTADYQVTGLSSFRGAIGHTRREQGIDANKISAATGMLGYRRQVTGKTAISIEFSRAVNSYITAGSSEIDTRGYISIDWEVTRRLGVVASHTQTRGKFVGDILPGANVQGRRDRFGTTRINLEYKALRALSIKPYFQYRNRNSNDPTLVFSGTLVGVELVTQRFGNPP